MYAMLQATEVLLIKLSTLAARDLEGPLVEGVLRATTVATSDLTSSSLEKRK